MIVVDTSALVAILLRESEFEACSAALGREPKALMSAGTLVEALIVAAGRNIAAEMSEFVERLGIEIVAVTGESARRVADAHRRWGKGVHPAGLNVGDCFAYALAQENRCPLLYVGQDFARTDVLSAL